MEKQFDIEIDHGGEKMAFTVKPIGEEGSRSYEILNAGVYYMTLECCSDDVADSLVLAKKDAERHIDPGIALKVAEMIDSEEE